jgi:plasmid replication initiation protein
VISGSHLQAVKYDYSTKVSALLASLSKRLCKYEEDDVYTTSSILDTRFKLLWSKPEDVDDLCQYTE